MLKPHIYSSYSTRPEVRTRRYLRLLYKCFENLKPYELFEMRKATDDEWGYKACARRVALTWVLRDRGIEV